MDEKQEQDLKTLNEIFNGVGFQNSLTDGSVDIYSFHDPEIQKAYHDIDKAAKLILQKYEDLQELEYIAAQNSDDE